MVAHACCRSRGESDVGTITKSAGVMAPSSRRPCGGCVHDGQPARRVLGGASQRAQVPRSHVYVAEGFAVVLGDAHPQAGAGLRVRVQNHGPGVGMPARPAVTRNRGAGGLGDPALVVRDGDNHDETPSGDSVVRCFKCFGTSACPLFSMSAFRFSVFSSMDVQRHGSAHPKERLLFRCRHHRR